MTFSVRWSPLAKFSGASALVVLFTSVATAQTSPSGASAARTEEPIKLSAFEVSGDSVGPYQAADSTGGSRVRVNLFEAMQSIYVVTPELMADLGAKSPLESLKYFPGVSRSTEPEGTM